MKNFLFFLFMLAQTASYGQNPDSVALIANVDQLIKTSRYNTDHYQHEEALRLAKNALKQSLMHFGERSVKTADCFFNMGRVYKLKGDFDEAEQFYLLSKDLRATLLGKLHPDYAWSLSNLGILYMDLGEYELAESLLMEALNIRKLKPGEKFTDYTTSLNSLGNLYLKKGAYEKAERYHLDAKMIRLEQLGNESLEYSMSLNNLGYLYECTGQYIKAESALLEALRIREKKLGKDHADYAQSLNNLANVYESSEQYEKAEALHLEALAIRAINPGKTHPDYAQSLNNLANVYCVMGQFEKAEPLYLEAKTILEKRRKRDPVEYARILFNLGGVYLNLGKYEKSQQYYLKGNEIRTKALGKEQQGYGQTLSSLAVLKQVSGDYLGSRTYFMESNKFNRQLIEQLAAYSTEAQTISYINTFDNSLAWFYSFVQTHPEPEIVGASYDNALFYNGFQLENARRLNNALATADSLSRNIYERWQDCRRRLAGEYAKPIAERKSVGTVEAEADEYEKILLQNLSAFAETRHVFHWQEVQQHLGENEAAIEFIHYQFYTPKPTEQVMYAAIILLPGHEYPRFVPLCEQSLLENVLHIRYQDKKYEHAQTGNSLYELLWKPIELLLPGINTVYYAPSGLLYNINFDAIQITAGSKVALIDKYRLNRLGSTRQLALPTVDAIANNDAVLLGGIRYEADSLTIQRENFKNGFLSRDDKMVSSLEVIDSINRIRKLDYLPGTLLEVQFIHKKLKDHDWTTFPFTGFAATEEAIKYFGAGPNRLSSPKLIHIATHGFANKLEDAQFSPKNMLGELPFYSIGIHPFLRAGLFFAGCDNARQTGRPIKEKMEDGILTAYEISSMSLKNTELVVLSACETGLGDVASHEGQYGLQRAFKIAGVQYLIVSLWPVSDENTNELMSLFYVNWCEQGMDIPTAFHNAQLEMKNGNDDPEKWAGFVIVR